MSRAMQFKARIKNLAIKNHVPAQAVLQDFMMERLLEKIPISKYKDKFILKGGMLIASMVGLQHRTTMDMDTTLRGVPLTEERIRKIFLEICSIHLEDGVTFGLDYIIPIREEAEYGGFRVAVIATYQLIRTPLKIDITSGDINTPAAIRYTYHSNFEDKPIEILAYNRETILAEKVETILRRSVFNTRPRDFYDVYLLVNTQGQAIDRKVFKKALIATSTNRGSLPSLEDNETILRTIQSDSLMRERWGRYCKENYYARDIGFDQVIKVLIDLLNKS